MKWVLLAMLIAMPFRCAHATDPPRCLPNIGIGNYHSAVTASGSTVHMLWCDDTQGLDSFSIGGTPNEAVACLQTGLAPFELSTAWVADLWAKCVTRTFTAEESALFLQLVFRWMPRLAVQGPTAKNIYTAKADGTRGAQWVNAGIGMQIAPGTTCKWGPRLTGVGRYARVDGYQSTNNVLIPAGSYAQCGITYPPATGWPTL